ncbi:MAG: DsbE family thiol:disulfide interchange protein [Alphaproteobacteria bacterium]|nr:DsbE family thiol:disulfide interchange protein [Alphaproteobacteria bacterium]
MRLLPIMRLLILLMALFMPPLAWAETAPHTTWPLMGQPTREVGIENFRGMWVLVNFFASWCRPCVAEHPQLMQLSQQRGLVLLGVAYRDRDESTNSFLRHHGSPYAAVGIDLSGRGAAAWGVRGIPQSFLVNPQGQIVWHHAGVLSVNNLASIREQIQ